MRTHFKITVLLLVLGATTMPDHVCAEKLGDFWNTSEWEEKYYPVTDIPIPPEIYLEAGSFEVLPDDSLAIGTRRGDIYIVSGVFSDPPKPEYHKFASGLDEVTGLGWKDGGFYVTQQTEVSFISDSDGDRRADSFKTLSDAWGFDHYHEYAFGSKPDRDGNIWVALCLSKSYESLARFRGWSLKITPDGRTIPIASGVRSPCGVGENAEGVMFYAESQGPWNGSCSLKHLKPGGFMGHPASFNWYPEAPNMGPVPVTPNTNSRLLTESKRVKELVPYAVVFPYRKMGQQLSGFTVDRSQGKFGPFANQIFIGDYTLGVVMRATTEKVNGVWQGACYPFREGFSTGLLTLAFSSKGQLIAGGTNRGWPVRSPDPFALQRVDWNGKTPFEIKEISVLPNGFHIHFTEPADRETATKTSSYSLETYTHIYRAGYGSPEVDHTKPTVRGVVMAEDGKSVVILVNGMVQGHVHDFTFNALTSQSGQKLVHNKAYYTLNEIPPIKRQ